MKDSLHGELKDVEKDYGYIDCGCGQDDCQYCCEHKEGHQTCLACGGGFYCPKCKLNTDCCEIPGDCMR